MIYNINDEIRIQLEHLIEQYDSENNDVHYLFKNIKEKNMELYRAFTWILISDNYTLLKYNEACQTLQHSEKKLLHLLENASNVTTTMTVIENDKEFFQLSINNFLEKQEHNDAIHIALLNYIMNYHSKKMMQLNPLFIYEMIYSTLNGISHRSTFYRDDFLNIYQYFSQSHDPKTRDTEYHMFSKYLMHTNKILYTDLLKNMINDFYSYFSKPEALYQYLKSPKIKEMFTVIRENDDEKILQYFYKDQIAFSLLSEFYSRHHQYQDQEKFPNNSVNNKMEEMIEQLEQNTNKNHM